MSLMAFLLQCGPLLGLTALTATLGFHLGERVPSGWWLVPTLGALAFLISLQIFKTVPRWNLVLLMGLALMAGTLLNWLDLRSDRWVSWVILSLGIVVPLMWAYGLGLRVVYVGALLFSITMAYVLGWLVLYFLPENAMVSAVWVEIGVLVFLGLAVHIVTEARFSQSVETPVPLAGDLFVVLFNLFWLGAAFAKWVYF